MKWILLLTKVPIGFLDIMIIVNPLLSIKSARGYIDFEKETRVAMIHNY